MNRDDIMFYLSVANFVVLLIMLSFLLFNANKAMGTLNRLTGFVSDVETGFTKNF